MLEGELTVIVGGKETVLKKHDSCVIGPNEITRDHQPRQRGLHDRGRGRAGEVTPRRTTHSVMPALVAGIHVFLVG